MKFPYLREALCSLFRKPATVTTPAPAAEGYRGRLVYHADRCINCGLCMRVCSPGAITKQLEKIDEGDRVNVWETCLKNETPVSARKKENNE